MLIHGGQLDRRMWDAQFEVFAKEHRVIRYDILVIGGERDVSDIHKIVAKLASEIPGAHKAILPGAGHLVPMEKSDGFNRLVHQFIAGHRRTQ